MNKIEPREKLTPFGKLVRKLRIDRSLLLKEMANGVGMSSAWLSGVETGRKPIPAGLVEKVANFFDLDKSGRAELAEAAENSRRDQSIKNVAVDRRDVAAALARRFNELDEGDLAKIRELLTKKRKG